MTIDIYAPIIPFQSIGGIKLYSSVDDLISILSQNNVEYREVHGRWLIYEIDDIIGLHFHKKNKKLFRIVTFDDYKGKLFEKIYVGMAGEDLQKVDSSFSYDDFEEVWVSPKGVTILTDPETNIVWSISIHIKELFTENFDKCEW